MKPFLLLYFAFLTAVFGVTPADYATPVTAAGEYSFPASIPAGNKCVFELAGNFSGAAVQIGYISPGGTFTSLGDAVRAPGDSAPVTIPLGPITGKATPALSITGGVSPSITLSIRQINPGTQPLNADSIIQALGYTPAEEGEAVDNATVNAAIADDYEATQTAIRLDSSTDVKALLAPRVSTVLKQGASFTKDARHITLFGLGDSLSHRTPDAMSDLLHNESHVIGYALGNAEPIVQSGTVVVPGTAMNGNFQPTMIDHGRVWDMSSGAVVHVGRYYVGAAVQTKSNVINLWCAKQASGGTLTVEHSEDNGSTWIAPGWTLATDGTAGTIAKQEFRIGAWATYQGTGTVYTTYDPAADTVTITGATGAFTGYNTTCARNGSLNGRPAYTVTGAVRVYFSDARQEWCIADPAATNPDFFINAFAEYPPTCAAQRDTLGTKQRLWRLTASVGNVDLIGAKIWDFQATGIVMCHAGNGGLALSNANQAAAAIRNGIGMDLGPTLTLATIVTNDAENITQAQIETFVDNWLTAVPVNDLVMFGNFAWPAGRDALNATIRTVLSTRPRAAFYDPIITARDYGYAAAQDWDDPDAIHYDDTFWGVIGIDVFRRAIAVASPGMRFTRVALDGTQIVRLGSHPVKAAAATRFEFPVSTDNRGSMGMQAMSTDGTEAYWRWFWNTFQSTSNTNQYGLTYYDNGYSATPLQFDRNGATAIGPVSTVSASSKSTQLWAKSRSSTFSAIRAETSGSTAAEIAQEWANSTAINATMLGDGSLRVKQLRVSAPTVPASATATGTAGDMAWDADYIYICTATNTWKRVAIATWP